MGNIQKSIKDLGVSVNGVEPNGTSTTEILKSFGSDFTRKEIVGETIAEVIENIAENYAPAPAFAVNVEAYNGTEDLFGKVASDLQENLVVNAAEVTGTSKYVDDYTGFSSKVEEQSGNYIVLHAESVDGAVITGELVGGTKGPVTLDADGLIVFRITSNTQSVRFTATKGNESVSVIYALTNLVLEEADIIQDGTDLEINSLDEEITQNGNTLIIGGNE